MGAPFATQMAREAHRMEISQAPMEPLLDGKGIFHGSPRVFRSPCEMSRIQSNAVSNCGNSENSVRENAREGGLMWVLKPGQQQWPCGGPLLFTLKKKTPASNLLDGPENATPLLASQWRRRARGLFLQRCGKAGWNLKLHVQYRRTISLFLSSRQLIPTSAGLVAAHS